MYKSRFEIERKLKQVTYLYAELNRFKNRVFVNNGLDPETDCYPLEIKLGTFLIYCRSIFQYAIKEVKESSDSNKKMNCFEFIDNNGIIGFFKDLRDNEIHSLAVSTGGSIILESRISSFDEDSVPVFGEKVSLHVEGLEDLINPSVQNYGVVVEHKITSRI